MSPLLSEILLRTIPEDLIAGVRIGEHRVYGSIIRSVVTGRIVGHLQETSGLAHLVGSLLTAPASLPLQAGGLGVDAIGHAVSYVQNEQIKAGLAALNSMQLAGLALGTAAIGASVAGFAVLSTKLNRVEAKLDHMQPKLQEIARVLRVIRADQLASDFVRLRTAAQQLDEAWLLPDPVSQWRSVATEAHFLANQLHRRAFELLDSTPDSIGLAEPFSEALCLAVNVRVSARMAAGEDTAAFAAAAEGARLLSDVGQQISLAKAALATMSREIPAASTEWGASLSSTAEQLRPVVDGYRAREQAAAATCLTLAELQRQQISGRAWLEAARNEAEEPFLCLVPASAVS